VHLAFIYPSFHTSLEFMKRPRALAELIDETLQPVLAAQGFASTDIVASWPELVGEKLAEKSEPVKINWPRKTASKSEAEPATLIIRVEGAFALDLQHLSPILIERVNARYGWKAIGKILLKQGPVRKTTPHRPLPPPSAEFIEKARDTVGALTNPALEEALVRLGAGILARKDPAP
jgi:hypothetical protein